MILVWILTALIKLATWLIGLLPSFSASQLSSWSSYFTSAGRIFGWLNALDPYLPIHEALIVFGFQLVIYSALYGVMGIRRVFSLIWPGAGS